MVLDDSNTLYLLCTFISIYYISFTLDHQPLNPGGWGPCYRTSRSHSCDPKTGEVSAWFYTASHGHRSLIQDLYEGPVKQVYHSPIFKDKRKNCKRTYPTSSWIKYNSQQTCWWGYWRKALLTSLQEHKGAPAKPMMLGASARITSWRQSLHQHLSVLRIFKGHVAASEALQLTSLQELEAGGLQTPRGSSEDCDCENIADEAGRLSVMKAGTLKGPAKERMPWDDVLTLSYSTTWCGLENNDL